MMGRDPIETRLLVILVSGAGSGVLGYAITGSVLRACACALSAFVFVAALGLGIGVAVGLAEASRYLIRSAAGVPEAREPSLPEEITVLKASEASEMGVEAESERARPEEAENAAGSSVSESSQG